MDDHTPLMQQYFRIKAEQEDALLLFQVGDFYELFFDDAKKAASCLGIALTARGKNKGEPIPLCGVPIHAIDHYLIRLIKAGFKVALCNQLEEAVPGKVVQRGVTQVLTPGTLTDTRLLDDKSASYLLSFFPLEHQWGLLFGELLTAQFFATVLNASTERQLETELARFCPDEIIMPQHKELAPFQMLFKKYGYLTSTMMVVDNEKQQATDLMHSWFRQDLARNDHVKQAFSTYESLQIALFYFYAYVEKNQLSMLHQPWTFEIYQPDDFLQLDAATQKNLELTINANGTKTYTLFTVLDQAATPMGSRLIKKWLVRPLVSIPAIVQRQEIIAFLVNKVSVANELVQTLKKMGDIERVIGRIALRRAPLHDYISLAQALSLVPSLSMIIAAIMQFPLGLLIGNTLHGFEPLQALLSAACSTTNSADTFIASGFDQELDQLRQVVTDLTRQILDLEKHEQERTKINSLKVGYNQVHGYYIEISKANLHLVPPDYIRYQTLVGKERYVTPLLQQMQQKIVEVHGTIRQVEEHIFERIKKEVISYIHPLRKLSHALATIDALHAFALAAYQSSYVCPQFNEDGTVTIREGRHPVVERVSNRFIPNDTIMNDQASCFIITGPNMGGKSTYLRQVALNAIMAQCGSFVPASYANMPIFDRIFTRIGAGDNLAQGKSTFLVEMEETATICANATKNSLVILDEVGRGTSTIDGLAIAQAVVEYLHTVIGVRTLFATHYHELTRLAERHPGIVSCYAASKKMAQGILFLYKIVNGVADGSFGIEVARLANLPQSIVLRAQELAQELCTEFPVGYSNANNQSCCADTQYELARITDMTQQVQKIVQKLQTIDCNNITPRQALDLLEKLQRDVMIP